MTELKLIEQALSEYLTVDRVAMLIFVFNCAVQSLPDPNGGKFYQFIYSFAHLLAGNVNLVRKVNDGARFHKGQQGENPSPRMGETFVA